MGGPQWGKNKIYCQNIRIYFHQKLFFWCKINQIYCPVLPFFLYTYIYPRSTFPRKSISLAYSLPNIYFDAQNPTRLIVFNLVVIQRCQINNQPDAVTRVIILEHSVIFLADVFPCGNWVFVIIVEFQLLRIRIIIHIWETFFLQ